MTAFRTIENSEIAKDQPLLSDTLTALRDNPISVFEADPTAPKISIDALETKPVGISDRYVAVTRAVNTSYRNTTGGPIEVAVRFQSSGGIASEFQISQNGTTWLTLLGGFSFSGAVTVRDDEYYQIVDGSTTVDVFTVAERKP